jgi:hypothetical protein
VFGFLSTISTQLVSGRGVSSTVDHTSTRMSTRARARFIFARVIRHAVVSSNHLHYNARQLVSPDAFCKRVHELVHKHARLRCATQHNANRCTVAFILAHYHAFLSFPQQSVQACLFYPRNNPLTTLLQRLQQCSRATETRGWLLANAVFHSQQTLTLTKTHTIITGLTVPTLKGS